MSGDVFISYRRGTSNSSDRLIDDRLSTRLGRGNVFFDVEVIDLGIDFERVLRERVLSCAVMIVVIGRDWDSFAPRLNDPHDYVRIEIQTALDRDIPVIPVLVDGASMPAVAHLPDEIKGLLRRQKIEIDHSRFDSDVRNLMEAVSRHLGNEKQGLDLPRADYSSIGPLTLVPVLKGPENVNIGDAYPTGKKGAHLVFDLFNPSAQALSVHEVRVDVLVYTPLNLDHLLHGVGATDVKRRFQVLIRPELGSYLAAFIGQQVEGEYVKVLPEDADALDVEVAAETEGIYDICVRIVGGCAGKRVDALLQSTRRQIVFFDKSKIMVDRGLEERMLTYDEYIREMKGYDLGGQLSGY